MIERLRRALYSHQRGHRPLAFVFLGLVSIGVYSLVVHIPDSSVAGSVLKARKEAVQTALRGQAVIRSARETRGLVVNPGDRFGTGLIGVASSPVTTELGSLDSHRTAANPVFAAAVVQMLSRAGVGEGDLVAVGQTGSYPGFDLDVEAAVEALGARAVTVSLIGSSAYGANEIALTWVDMETELARAGVIHRRSAAVGPGGSLAGPDAARRLQLVQDSGLPTIPVLPTTEAVKYLDRLYIRAANRLGTPIAAFVDVGGSSVVIGSGGSESIIRPGLSRPRWTPFEARRLGVVGRMALRGIPIVAMIDVASLARQFGVAFDPHLRPTARDIAEPPPNPIGVVLALLVLVGLVVGMHRLGLFRVPHWELPAALRRRSRRPGPPRQGPEPGVPPEDAPSTDSVATAG
ncbi:MAG TPA: poly-gamma-glutamate system protein [Actinomycetota bacterium]